MAPQRRHRATSFLVLLALCVAPAHGGRALPAASKGAVSKAQAAANATAGDEFLAPHNKARVAVGVAPLRWSADLATAAATTTSQQQLNKNCAFADMAASPYGANQGWASYRARPAEVVASWVDQGRYYTHANNSCVAGKQCGTYTQVVWRRTAQLGCAQASCASAESLSAWLPIAARSLSGAIQLEVVRRESETEIGERCAAIDLPCFEKAIIIKLKLGFLGLALPPSGVFSRLGDLQLVDIQLHGQSSRLGDLLSSQRCPSLMSLLVSDCRGLDSLNIHSNSLLHLKLLYLHHLQQLTVVAPALKRIKVIRCFTDPLNPDQSVVNISAPQLMSLVWKNFRDPSSIQLDEVMNLKMLGIELLFLGGEEEAFDYNHNCMMLLRRFKRIRNLDLLISYLPGICTGPYLMDHMPRLPDITTLHMGVVAYGHSVGAILFNVLRSCTGVKDLFIDFLAELEEQTPCPSGCICDEPPNWRMEELALNCLEEMEIQGMRGTEHEVSFVQRLFRWATVLKEVTIIFHELITESKAKELRQLLLSFSRPDISMDISMCVP